MVHEIPRQWEAFVKAPLEESHEGSYLLAIDTLVDNNYIVSPEHLEALLYLAATNQSWPTSPPAISILHRMLDQHGAALATRLPTHYEGPALKEPWRSRRSERGLISLIRRAVRRVNHHGIWAMLREVPLDATKEERLQFKDSNADVDEELGPVTEHGWRVLAFLCELWKAENEKGAPTSFLRQLKRPQKSNLAYDDASSVFDLVKAATRPIGEVIAAEGPSALASIPRRRECARMMLELLIDCASNNEFHKGTLPVSLVVLLRGMQGMQLTNTLAIMCALQSWQAVSHVLALSCEDAMGTRVSSDANRRRRVGSKKKDGLDGLERPLEPPTAQYAVKLAVGVPEERAEIGVCLLKLLDAAGVEWDYDEIERTRGNACDDVDAAFGDILGSVSRDETLETLPLDTQAAESQAMDVDGDNESPIGDILDETLETLPLETDGTQPLETNGTQESQQPEDEPETQPIVVDEPETQDWVPPRALARKSLASRAVERETRASSRSKSSAPA